MHFKYKSLLTITVLTLILICLPIQAGRLYSSNLEYRGAFAYPAGDQWAYSGHALAFYPPGDTTGSGDGYPGSLFAVAHDWDQLVGEISIPAPVISTNFDDLPKATVLRPLTDITDGWIDNCTYDPECIYREVAGLLYLPDQNRIAWNLRDWYNVDGGNQDSLGWSAPDMTDAHGVWHIGPRSDPAFHNARTCNYLMMAPTGFADQYLSGRTVIAGNHRQAGAFGGSQGPTLYATAPWNDGNPPASGQDLASTALLYYPEDYDCTNNQFNACYYPDYRVADDWGGGAWIDTGVDAAVLIFGIKGLGDNCYGIPGESCPESACSSSKGWHSSPYEPQILFYDPADLAAVVNGQRSPWEVIPYEVFSPVNQMIRPECAQLGAVAFDRVNGLIYVTERQVGPWGETAVHVWHVAAGSAPVPYPDVKANDSDTPLSVSSSDNVSITISNDAAGALGVTADWWLLIGTPFCWCYLDASSGWSTGVDVTWQGPVVSFPSLELMTISGLPAGDYYFCLGLDFTVDGAISQELYFDYAQVTVTD